MVVGAAQVMTDGFTDLVGRAQLPWLIAAVLLHVAGQVCRGMAWHGVLSTSWANLRRRRVCAWHVCGAGLTGFISGRGGDVVRIGLARRELPGATCPAIAGTLVAEGSFEVLSGIALAIAAASIGVGSLAAPPLALVVAGGGLIVLAAVLATRSIRVRRFFRDLGTGLR